MLRKIFLPSILIVLAYGFWISPDFKVISAGVSIFLFGMLSLEEGFKAFSGGALEKILKKTTDTKTKSLLTGAVLTSIMQSSSLVSVLTISFLGAGLIGLAEGIGIVFGANIGTTTGAWLVAGLGLKVKISAYAMPMLVFGIILIFQKAKSLKGIGYILAGLGFLFLGIHYMKEGFEAFKSTIDLAAYGGTGLKYLFIFTGIGVFATVVMQSSHATLVLIITALFAGQISYENALALAIGANVGTTITAILGAMSSNIVGKRLAGAHLIFNLTTGLIAIIFMHQIMISVDWISDLVGIANDNYTLKLAVFHTIFNVIGVVVMMPFIGKLVVFLERILKDKNMDNATSFDKVQYLNNSVLELPTTAMVAIVNETKHLYRNAFEVIAHGLNLKRENITSNMSLGDVLKEPYSKDTLDVDDFYVHRIKGIYGEIVDFSTKAQSMMSPEDNKILYHLKLANRDIVSAVKDTEQLQVNIVKYSISKNDHIRKQYDSIRLNMVELLRDINKIATIDDEAEVLGVISKVKVHIEQYDIVANNVIDDLVRKGLIPKEMATSLMNDSAYAYDIGKKLIAMAEVIFAYGNSDMIMDQEDLKSVIYEKEI